MREIGHFIGGREVRGASARFGEVFNPNTGEVSAKSRLRQARRGRTRDRRRRRCAACLGRGADHGENGEGVFPSGAFRKADRYEPCQILQAKA